MIRSNATKLSHAGGETVNSQPEATPALAAAAGSERVWTCDQCGSTGPWTSAWSTWGSLHEAEVGRRLVVCSEVCRDASDPESLWLRKYGEPPRKFRSFAGGYMAAPCKNGARQRRSPNATGSATGDVKGPHE